MTGSPNARAGWCSPCIPPTPYKNSVSVPSPYWARAVESGELSSCWAIRLAGRFTVPDDATRGALVRDKTRRCRRRRGRALPIRCSSARLSTWECSAARAHGRLGAGPGCCTWSRSAHADPRRGHAGDAAYPQPPVRRLDARSTARSRAHEAAARLAAFLRHARQISAQPSIDARALSNLSYSSDPPSAAPPPAAVMSRNGIFDHQPCTRATNWRRARVEPELGRRLLALAPSPPTQPQNLTVDAPKPSGWISSAALVAPVLKAADLAPAGKNSASPCRRHQTRACRFLDWLATTAILQPAADAAAGRDGIHFHFHSILHSISSIVPPPSTPLPPCVDIFVGGMDSVGVGLGPRHR